MMKHKRTPKKARAYKVQPSRGDKFDALPPAIIDGKFIVEPKGYVNVWRTRSDRRDGWYRCEVVSVTPDYVSLWDTIAQQCFCFDPTAQSIPDVRVTT